MKMKYYKFVTEPTKDTVLIVFNKEQLQSAIVKVGEMGATDILASNMVHGIPNGYAGTHYYSEVRPDIHIIFIDEDECKSALMFWQTAAHESLHCASSIWHNVGANLHVRENDEVIAYTMNYIMEKIDDAHQLYEDTQYVSNREQDL